MTNPQPKSFWDEAASRVQQRPPRLASGAAVPAERRPLRRDPPAPTVKPLLVTDDQLQLRLAEELEYARRMLEAMGEQLAGDASVIVRHGTALQSVDIVGQMLGHLANVVRCSSPEDAVDRIGMTELKGRLKRRNL